MLLGDEMQRAAGIPVFTMMEKKECYSSTALKNLNGCSSVPRITFGSKASKLYSPSDVLIFQSSRIRLLTPFEGDSCIQCPFTISIKTNQLTNQLTPWSKVLLERLLVTQLVKKFPAFYGTRTLITVFTTARH